MICCLRTMIRVSFFCASVVHEKVLNGMQIGKPSVLALSAPFLELALNCRTASSAERIAVRGAFRGAFVKG